jgi:hypothetical protein
MSGFVKQYTENDLEHTAIAYNLKKRAAPLCLGHPANNEPSFGEANSLFVKEGKLYADITVHDALVALVRKGAMKAISASFLAPDDPGNPWPGVYYLNHIGFLGAMAPAVKGMEAPAFAENPGALCFSDTFDSSLSFADSCLNTPPQGYAVDAQRSAVYVQAAEFRRACPALSFGDAVTMAGG